MRPAVVLYGPPACGKDTITRALAQRDANFELYRKIKLGGGACHGYRPTSDRDLEWLRVSGLVLYENERYGNVYAVDYPHLDELADQGRVPIVHMGQIAGVRAVLRYPADWLTVLLWCPRRIAERRAHARGSSDVSARLTAWDETAVDLARHRSFAFSLRLRTDLHPPATAASMIHAACGRAGAASAPSAFASQPSELGEATRNRPHRSAA